MKRITLTFTFYLAMYGAMGQAGCTIETAVNFDPSAEVNDGSCLFEGCDDPEACNYDPSGVPYAGLCTYPLAVGTVQGAHCPKLLNVRIEGAEVPYSGISMAERSGSVLFDLTGMNITEPAGALLVLDWKLEALMGNDPLAGIRGTVELNNFQVNTPLGMNAFEPIWGGTLYQSGDESGFFEVFLIDQFSLILSLEDSAEPPAGSAAPAVGGSKFLVQLGSQAESISFDYSIVLEGTADQESLHTAQSWFATSMTLTHAIRNNACLGDLNSDGEIGTGDLLDILGEFGTLCD